MTGALPLLTYRYRVDRAGTLVEVGPHWDDFARSNGGAHLLADNVTGRELRTFITDPTTLFVYDELYRCVRKHGPTTFPFRCDAPGRRRFMEMTLRPADDGGVWMESREVRVEERPTLELLDSHLPLARRNGSPLHLCSWCKRARLDERWLELESYVRETGVMERAKLPLITHGMCPTCEAEMMVLIERASPGDEGEP